MQILRQLASEVNAALGSRQGTKHGSPDLVNDIKELMDSLSHNEVYVIQPGRSFDEEDTSLAEDVASSGYNMLTFGQSTPLKQFNESLSTLQQRYRVMPLVGPSGSEQERPDLSLVHNEGPCSLPFNA